VLIKQPTPNPYAFEINRISRCLHSSSTDVRWIASWLVDWHARQQLVRTAEEQARAKGTK
jgi:hypothetical protein